MEVTEMEFIYNEVSHKFDENVDFKMLPEFGDCWILYGSDFQKAIASVSEDDTEYKDAMKVLIKKIKSHCITHYGHYIIKQDTLSDILENFYKEPRKTLTD
jgi:hypothetical protein